MIRSFLLLLLVELYSSQTIRGKPYRVNDEDCWEPCGSKGGLCDYCGQYGYCCRKRYSGCPRKLQAVALRTRHTCIRKNKAVRCPLNCRKSTEVCERVESKWRCLCKPGRSGKGCQTQTSSTCTKTTTIRSANVIIKYPYNSYYPISKLCKWRIIAGKPIYIQFTKFDLEESSDCKYDYLKIKENRVVKNTYCGRKRPKSWTAVSGDVEFTFNSDNTETATGFIIKIVADVCSTMDAGCHKNARCEMTSIGTPQCICNRGFMANGVECTDRCDSSKCNTNATCKKGLNGTQFCECKPGFQGNGTHCTGNVISACGGNITNSTGQIMYPLSGYYSASKLCIWNINATVPLFIQFTRFLLEWESACDYDFLQIQDKGKLVGKYCGYQLPPNVTSTTGNVTLIFRSDSSVSGYGFLVNIDKDVCQTSEHTCPENSKCIMNNRSFVCTCKPNFEWNGTHCADINECAISTHNCHRHATCINLRGTFSCACNKGYGGSGTSCVEVCPSELNVTCDYTREVCKKVQSKWRCACNDKYSGKDCERDWYTSCGGNIISSKAEIRYPKARKYGNNQKCIWRITASVPLYLNFTKFSLESHRNCGYDYLQINDGVQQKKLCGIKLPFGLGLSGNATMLFYSDDYTVDNGFVVLVDKDVCQTNEYTCVNNSKCVMNSGGYTCTCKPGYQWNGPNCTDINECVKSSHDCDSNANCTNTIGSFTCMCKQGYRGDGKTCIELCPPHVNATCNHTTQVCEKRTIWLCACNKRYTGKNCDRKFYFACERFISITSPKGMIKYPLYGGNYGNNEDCTWSINTNVPIHIEFIKFQLESSPGCRNDYVGRNNIQGVRYCGSKNPGSWKFRNGKGTLTFHSNNWNTQDGFTALIDKDVCETGEHTCPEKATCIMKQSIPQCKCVDGYIWNGTNCNDANECKKNTHHCHRNAICNNTIGSFKCTCKKGFRGDGRFRCVEFCPLAVSKTCNTTTARCRKVFKVWKCVCLSNYVGKNCERRLYSTCGGTITSPTSVIMFPISGLYSRYQDCTWNVRTGVPTHMYYTRLQVESCIDYVMIKINGSRKTHCRTIPPSFNVLSNFQVLFHSDSSVNKRGFVLYINKDVCKTNEHSCGGRSKCTMRKGKVLCRCQTGFKQNGTTCSDINECATNKHRCHQYANCTNTIGSHVCTCMQGFRGDGKTCIEHCPLNLNATCDHSKEICKKVDNKWKCVCNSFYMKKDCTRAVYTSCDRGIKIITHANVDIKFPSTGVYGRGFYCRWQIDIRGPIYLRFTKFDLKYYYSCGGDYIMISSSTTATSRRYCGTAIPPSFRSLKGKLLITFRSDRWSTRGKSGFRLLIDRDVCSVHTCHKNATCSNMGGYPVCKCKFGFIGNGNDCTATICSTCLTASYTKEHVCSSTDEYFRLSRRTSFESCLYSCENRFCRLFVYDPDSEKCYFKSRDESYQCNQPTSIMGRDCSYVKECTVHGLLFKVVTYDARLDGWRVANTSDVQRSMDQVKDVLRQKTSDIIVSLGDGSITGSDDEFEIDKYYYSSGAWPYKLLTKFADPVIEPKEGSFNLTACIIGVIITIVVIVIIYLYIKHQRGPSHAETFTATETVPLYEVPAPPVSNAQPATPSAPPIYTEDLLPIASTHDNENSESSDLTTIANQPPIYHALFPTGTVLNHPREIPTNPEYVEPVPDDFPPPPSYEDAIRT